MNKIYEILQDKNYRKRRGIKKVSFSNETMDRLSLSVLGFFKETTLEEIKSPNRKHRIVIPRAIIIFIAYNYLDYKQISIANYFSRDHSTIIHSMDLVKDLADTNKDFVVKFNEIYFYLTEVLDIKTSAEWIAKAGSL
jgi:chromosomal replication initiation ATPase DnaA